ncbi:hypothetical protein [Haloterrigena alkaliphila]|uniref:hypothetical protein n=1 Tax=Haloterrigena alkaliphila TaxID=2816475 RepID=UPI001CEC588C|nr:hypothetical protein [Haloterrigena alkaliphila]UHQ95040.1 hypothetical protein J0X25_05865 [Haloterrigena alkaliphila]
MNRTTSIALAAVLLVATVAAPLAAASVVSSGSTQNNPADGGNESIAPGERFAAAVGVQNAEIEGDVSERALGARISNAETNESKAAVIATHVEESETRLAKLEDRLETLNESREAGDLSDGRYRAKVATIVAEMRAIERQATVAERGAVGLSAELAERGIDRESIRTLRDRAGELGGPNTASIARSIAGDDVGRPASTDRGPGAPTDVPGANRSDERGLSDERDLENGNETGGESNDS